MLTLDLANAPRWHDLAPGVRLSALPVAIAGSVQTNTAPKVASRSPSALSMQQTPQ
ncbi:MAG: hypothetical protein ACK5MY_09825 [Jhaorihella sp.]